jgi:hypothetical protein
MRAQLQHLIDTVSAEPRITLVVLPYDAPIIGGLLPMSSFMLYTFADPTDPPMALAETVSTDLVHSEATEFARYKRHYDRLWHAALSPAKSIAYLETTPTADD